ncbi:hypothetical protein QG145_10720, partial [Kingella kingae]|nr:hypothetical protein [Kingella kingae]
TRRSLSPCPNLNLIHYILINSPNSVSKSSLHFIIRIPLEKQAACTYLAIHTIFYIKRICNHGTKKINHSSIPYPASARHGGVPRNGVAALCG